MSRFTSKHVSGLVLISFILLICLFGFAVMQIDEDKEYEQKIKHVHDIENEVYRKGQGMPTTEEEWNEEKRKHDEILTSSNEVSGENTAGFSYDQKMKHMYQRAYEYATTHVSPLNEAVKEKASEYGQKMKEASEQAAEFVKEKFDDVKRKTPEIIEQLKERGEYIKDKAPYVWEDLKRRTSEASHIAMEKGMDILREAQEISKTALDKIKQESEPLVDNVREKVESTAEYLKEKTPIVAEKTKESIYNIYESARPVIREGIDHIPSFFEKFKYSKEAARDRFNQAVMRDPDLSGSHERAEERNKYNRNFLEDKGRMLTQQTIESFSKIYSFLYDKMPAIPEFFAHARSKTVTGAKYLYEETSKTVKEHVAPPVKRGVLRIFDAAIDTVTWIRSKLGGDEKEWYQFWK